MTDHQSQWKANVALGIQLVVQLRLFSPVLTPCLLCSLPSLQELSSPFLSVVAELSSYFHLFLSQQDGRMLGKADRGEQTWLDERVISAPPPASSLSLASSYPSVTLLLPLSSFYLFRPLIYPLPLFPSLFFQLQLSLSHSVSLMAWLQAVLQYWKQHGAWGVIWY